MEMMATERVCYVHCNFCNTILAVSVPYSGSMVSTVTVRCGHCSNLLSVNLMGASAPLVPAPPPPPHHHHQSRRQEEVLSSLEDQQNRSSIQVGSSSKDHAAFETSTMLLHHHHHHHHQQQLPRIPPIRPPEKRQRVPSAYNRFIKDEIQRIKASNPDISHREAFSTAAKNWAHFPHIHFGLKQAKLDQQGEGNPQKSNGFY